VIGGEGTARIEDASIVNAMGRQTMIYEKSDKTIVALGEEGRLIEHGEHGLYNYDRTRFAYNRYRPIFMIGSSSTDGFGVTAGVHLTQQKFGKQDFSAQHTIKGRITAEDIAIIDYKARFRHVVSKWDVEIGGIIANNNDFTFFYGLGNNTVKDDVLDSEGFYDTRYETFGGYVGVAREFWRKSSIRFGANYENNSTIIDPGTILAVPLAPGERPIPGIDDANLIEAIAEIDIDFRDRADLPEQGVRMYLKHQSGINSSENDGKGYGITRGFIERYGSLRMRNPWTLGFRLGGSRSYGEEVIPFYKRVFLGQQNGLRGYEENRFAGKSTIYLDTELRIQLAQFKTSIVPMKIGIKAFYDLGRVYTDRDIGIDDGGTHSGYGFGFYLVPLKQSFAINVSAGFSEEESGLILIGIGAALN
jgi:hypothetical protein